MRCAKKSICRTLLVLCLAAALLAALSGAAWGAGPTWTCEQDGGYFNSWPSFSGTVSGSVVTSVYAAVYDSEGVNICSPWTPAGLTVVGDVYSWSVSVGGGLPEAPYQLRTAAYDTYGQPYSNVGVFEFVYDATPPQLQSVQVNYDTLVLAFDEELDAGSVPAPGDFSVINNPDDQNEALYKSGVGVSGNTVILTLETPASSISNLFVTYTPGANPVRDLAGNEAAGLMGEPVQNLTPFAEPQLTFTFLDNDADHVYFDGRAVNILAYVTNLAPGDPVRVAAGIFTGETFDISNQVLTSFDYHDDQAGYYYKPVAIDGYHPGFAVAGNVNNPGNATLPPGIIGVQLYQADGSPLMSQPVPLQDAQGRAALVGVSIPSGDITVNPALEQFADLYNTENPITFTREDCGSIQFPAGLDIINHRHELQLLQSGITLAFENGALVGGVDTGSLTFLADKGATIRFFGVMQKLGLAGITADNFRDYLEVAVEDNGEAVTDIAQYIDLAQMSYDPDTDTLIMPVKHFTTFRVVRDATPPQVVSFSPADDASGAAVDAGLQLTFSENVTAQAGKNITVFNSDGSPFVQVAADGAEVTGSGTNTVTIDLPSNFDYSAGYYVLVDQGAFKDAAGNEYQGIGNAATWNFTTAAASDTTNPAVTTTDPSHEAVGVALDKTITVTFSEEIQPGGAFEDIAIQDAAGNPVEISTSINGSILNIDPADNLAYSTNYTVMIPHDAVEDLAGLPFGDENGYSFSFRTRSRPSSSGGSGGGGTVTSPPAPEPKVEGDSADVSECATVEKETNADGTTTVNVTLEESAVNKALAAGEVIKEVVLEITKTADDQVVTVPAGAFGKLAEKQASLVLKTGKANLSIPGNVIDIDRLAQQLGASAGQVQVNIQVKEVPVEAARHLTAKAAAADAALKPVGRVLQFNLEAKVGGKAVDISSFGDKRVRGEFLLTPEELKNVGDLRKLNAYRFDEAGQQWNYVRSKVDAASKKVIFITNSFSSYTVMEYAKTFADMRGHWAKTDVELMASKYVVKGKTPELFLPEDKVTRAEFATLLVRALGLSEEKPAQGRFSDVAPDAWYSGSVEAAARAGLVKGMGNGRFAPDDLITREQMAVMIVRALEQAGKKIALSAAEQEQLLARFSDRAKIQNWAAADLVRAVKSGLLKGVTATTIEPAANATRAQAAVMIKRMMEKADLL